MMCGLIKVFPEHDIFLYHEMKCFRWRSRNANHWFSKELNYFEYSISRLSYSLVAVLSFKIRIRRVPERGFWRVHSVHLLNNVHRWKRQLIYYISRNCSVSCFRCMTCIIATMEIATLLILLTHYIVAAIMRTTTHFYYRIVSGGDH